MIWPFKKRKVQTVAEYAATQPMPKCGKPETHYRWKLEGWSCPACASIEQRTKAQADEDRMAEKIAAAVARKMKENQHG